MQVGWNVGHATRSQMPEGLEAVTIARLFKQFASRRKLLFKRVFNLNTFNASGARDRVQTGRFKHGLNRQKMHLHTVV
jgi:hypothetical protein